MINMISQMSNNSIVNGLASQAIVPIIDGLARPVWNPFLTSWPAVRCNPKFGLYYLYIIYGPFFEEISNTITVKSVKCYIKNGIKLGGCHNPKFGLYDLYIIYGPFFQEISNMIAAKSVMACSKCYIKNGVEFRGMGSMTLSDFDDLYLIRCEMSYKLHI